MIRKITFCAFILLFNILSAQQTQNAEFKNAANQVFQNLDKSRIPNGILLDYGMDFTNLLAFDGVLRDSTLTTSQTITDIYKTLLMSRVTQSSSGFISMQEYSTRWYSQREPGVMILSGLFFNYSKFDENAYPSKLNYTNNQFSDKFTSGVWQNPYIQKQVFAISPAVNTQNELNLKVKLPSNLFLSNNSAGIQNIQIDFSNNQGYQVVNYNQLINVNYSAEGYYTWRYKLTLTNGQILNGHSKVKIGNPIVGECINCEAPIGPYLKTASTQTNYDKADDKIPITATTPYKNQFGKAVLHINYASPDHQIRKPLIVAEGFDLGVIVSPEQEEGLNTRLQFINKYTYSGSGLPSALSSYDIIYVNWNNGVDFIQKNAYVLEEVIKYVNARKAVIGSTTPNVIIGQSMGGLIARYALRDIELNRNFNHDTKMYISHDAPHLGANTPLSVQYAMRHIRNIYVSSPIAMITGESDIPVISNLANGIIDLINSNNGNNTDLNEIDYVTPLTVFSASDAPAARQMMVNWMNRKYEIKNGIHDLWQQELTAMGYPQGYPGKPIRNIAIANGSECGVLQPDNGNIMSYIKTAGSNTALSNYIGILDGVYGTFLSRPDIVSVGLLPGNSKWEINFQSKYMTVLNDNKNIYHGSIKYKKKVLWFIPVSITVSEKNAAQPSNILPYDIYGGGRQQTSTSDLVLDGIVSNSFSFIPTASALDIGKGLVTLTDSDFRKPYAGAIPPAAPKNTPFQNFVTDFNKSNPSASNSGHINFNARNGNWLASELEALSNPALIPSLVNCSYMCSDFAITGNETLCASEVYSVPNLSSSYNWTITEGSNLVTLTGSNTNTVVLNRTSVYLTGKVTLSLNLGNDNCGNKTLTKIITVGTPIAVSYNGPGPYGQLDVIITGNSGSYFKIYKGESTLLSSSETGGIRTVNFGCSGGLLKVEANTPCGIATARVLVSGGCPRTSRISNAVENTSFYQIYPNPSSHIINISLFDETITPSSQVPITAILYDLNGQEKRSVSVVNNTASINVSGLKKGIHVLKINIDGATESHQVIIE